MKNFTKLALTLAAAGSVCYLFRDKLKTTKAYQTVESNDTIKKAKAAASDSYHKVKESDTVKKIKENENVKKAASAVTDTYRKVKDSESAHKAKETIKGTYKKVKESDTVKKAKDTVSDKYDKIKDTIKDKMDHTDDSDREYFTLHGQSDLEASDTETSASVDIASEVSEEDTAKAVTEAVAETEDVIAEATGAVAQAADSKNSDVIGDEYMGLSDTSEDPSVLEEQDKLDV